jgi:hypothetical protein
MYVIRHYHVPTDRDIALPCITTKCLMHFRSCQEAFTFVRVECDEVKRPIVSNKRLSLGGRRDQGVSKSGGTTDRGQW